MFVSAIVLAAGKGVRFNSKVQKPLVKIGRRPLVIHSLGVLSNHPLINEIIVVANPFNSPGITKEIKQYRIGKIKTVVLGGRQRKDSVYNGLKAIAKEASLVLVHDGARPFIDSKTLFSVIKTAKKNGAAILGVPVKATIKRAQGPKLRIHGDIIVKDTIDRSNLWEIQTPQVFRKDIILKAYDLFRDLEATDDAMLVEKLGFKVSVVLGSYDNIKVTTPEDLVIAEAIAKKKI